MTPDNLTSQNQAAGIRDAANAIQSASSILITTHINPDGDAIGSALGLWHILKALGKRSVVVTQDGAGQRYQFLPGAADISTNTDATFDLGIAVDCGNIVRVGKAGQYLRACRHMMRIDHHAVGESFGDLEFIDTNAAAVGEMITALAEEMGAAIPAEAGNCLLASIVEDTGCFQFSSVSPQSFRICADLVESGADLHWVVQNLFWRNSEGAVRMAGKCLQVHHRDFGGQLAWTIAALDDFAHFGAIQEDMDEVVHDLLGIDGVEVALLLRESQKSYRISLRSRNYVDVAGIASEFGGGGHHKAAGCQIDRTDDAMQSLIQAIGRHL
ncbi:MAG: bifunctional oligoribonuclease/PAP phosphatase NrnA [Armatimonadota bacterium]